MGGQVRVFANVSVAQLMTLNPKLSKSQRELASQQLYGEALDFILCSPHDLKVRATVLLAESGLSKKEQRKQQQFWHALRAAGLPVIELCARNWPSPSELRSEILTACKAPSPAPQASTRLGTARVEPVFSPLDNEPSIEDNEPVIKISAND
ncbi:DUF2726 domain-containing protein [Oceanisphaera avium]|nr:DUF2726 domain-containing protein [Oceanisphaera avium]